MSTYAHNTRPQTQALHPPSIRNQPQIPPHRIPPALQPRHRTDELVLPIQAIQNSQHPARGTGDPDVRDDRFAG